VAQIIVLSGILPSRFVEIGSLWSGWKELFEEHDSKLVRYCIGTLRSPKFSQRFQSG